MANGTKEEKETKPLSENANGLCWLSITVEDAKAIGLNPEKMSGREVVAEVRSRAGIPEREGAGGARSPAKAELAEALGKSAEDLTASELYREALAEIARLKEKAKKK